MWHVIPAILYLTCVQGHQHRQLYSPYSAVNNNDRMKLAPYSYYPGQGAAQAQYNSAPARQYPDYPTAPLSYNYPAQRQPQNIEDPYYNTPLYNKAGMQNPMYYNRNADLRQSQSQTKPNLLAEEVVPFELDDNNDMDVDPKTFFEGQSYFNDLELVEHFGNYLKRRTRTYVDGSSTSLNDAAHQYNALLSVIIALARIVRNSCSDFDQVYDQVYSSTVDTYYKYGLTNPDKVADMIEGYINTGNSHIPKLRKLKQELCGKEVICLSLDNKVKASPLLYVKELETLEALSHLVRSYYPYIEEFNQAAKKGSVLAYLQNSKDRLKEYVMHVVNSVEHISDKAVKCT